MWSSYKSSLLRFGVWGYRNLIHVWIFLLFDQIWVLRRCCQCRSSCRHLRGSELMGLWAPQACWGNPVPKLPQDLTTLGCQLGQQLPPVLLLLWWVSPLSCLLHRSFLMMELSDGRAEALFWGAFVSFLMILAGVCVWRMQTAVKQKIRIKLRSYWVDLIEQACQQILEAARNSNAQTMGPVPLPTKKRVYCVLRSPHVNKDAREHFEIRTHRRLIDLENPNAQTIDALMQLDLPAGVDVEVKLT